VLRAIGEEIAGALGAVAAVARVPAGELADA
jgi:hypothetical protein